jgi:ABC-type Fe3+ transport system permease subunit
MLTIPDELIDAARMDNASEWQIYWRIVLPLAAPALAVLAIFSVVWRWNDFLWPLVVLSRKELYTLQVGLNTYAGELNVQWHFILAMTVVTMIPVVLVFIFLQRYITTGDGEFCVFVGPSGCGKSTLAAHDRGAGRDHRRRDPKIGGRDVTRCRPRNAAWRWCSSPTRSTRT